MRKKRLSAAKKRALEEIKPPQQIKQVQKQEEPVKEAGSIFDKQISSKTFIVSQIIIFLVGLGFLGWLYYSLNGGYNFCSINIPNPFCSNLVDIKSYQPVTKEPVSFSLEITNPDDELLSSDKEVIFSGKSSPGSAVIISGDNTNIGLETNSKGEFSKVISLLPGLNKITVTAFDEFGNQKSETRTIYYQQEKL